MWPAFVITTVYLQAERIDIEERYSSLQEECAGKGKKLRKITSMLLSAKSELADLGQEHQREMEGLLDSVRMLTKELALQEYIQNSFIPREYQVRYFCHLCGVCLSVHGQ